MFEQQLDILLQQEWSEDEHKLISRLMDNVTYYKKLIPKSLKQDIMNALQMCNVLKTELDLYRKKCICIEHHTKTCCNCGKIQENLEDIQAKIDEVENSQILHELTEQAQNTDQQQEPTQL